VTSYIIDWQRSQVTKNPKEICLDITMLGSRFEVHDNTEPTSKRCCSLAEEDPQHLFIGSAVINIIWNSALSWDGLAKVVLVANQNLKAWWKQALTNQHNTSKKKLNIIHWSCLSLGKKNVN
jgi:hypothetical protein